MPGEKFDQDEEELDVSSLTKDYFVIAVTDSAEFCHVETLTAERTSGPIVTPGGYVVGLVGLSRDRLVAFGSWCAPYSINLLDVESDQIVARAVGHENGVYKLKEISGPSLASDDGIFASTSTDQTVRFWNTKGLEISNIGRMPGCVRHLQYSRSSQSLYFASAVPSESSTITTLSRWNVDLRMQELQGQTGIIDGFAIDEASERLFCCPYSRENTTSVVTFSPNESSKPVARFPLDETTRGVGTVYYDSPTQCVIVLCGGGRIQIFDIREGKGHPISDFRAQMPVDNPCNAEIWRISDDYLISLNDTKEISKWTLEGKIRSVRRIRCHAVWGAYAPFDERLRSQLVSVAASEEKERFEFVLGLESLDSASWVGIVVDVVFVLRCPSFLCLLKIE